MMGLAFIKNKKAGREQEGNAHAPCFSVKHMDPTADALHDFYTYAAGGWLATHEIPADKSSWGAFQELEEYNMVQLRRIVEECASAPDPKDPHSRMIGDLFASALDTSQRERLGFAPIEDLLRLVESIESPGDMMGCISYLHTVGVNALFNTYSMADKKNSEIYALYVDQGGLSLPDIEYYLSDKYAGTREDFKKHVSKTFMLAGIPEAQAVADADTILEIETEMAKSSRTNTELMDEEKNYNRTEARELGRYGSLALPYYLKKLGVEDGQYIIIGQPEFFEKLNSMLSERSMDQWKAYLTWYVIGSYAQCLHEEVESIDFDFFQRKLRGQDQPEPRWKNAIYTVESGMGDALGKIYVERHFDEYARTKAKELVRGIVEVLRERMQAIPWMSDETRTRAVEKLDKMGVKIGYPDRFRDYSGLVIDRDDYVGNIRRFNEFETRRLIARVGKPVDKDEWSMNPQAVNAYYSPTKNEIVFPAGILQPPFFDAAMDYAVNFGAIGTVIGHEITHGFDDQGRLYDANGNIQNWWKKEDEARFRERSALIVRAYGSQEALPETFVNGELTLDENIADLAGVSLAYDALQRKLKADPSMRKPIDSLTQEQRFFIAYAQIWRELVKEKELERSLLTDPHSPNKYRVTIPATSHLGFRKAFRTEHGEEEGQAPQDIGLW